MLPQAKAKIITKSTKNVFLKYNTLTASETACQLATYLNITVAYAYYHTSMKIEEPPPQTDESRINKANQS